MELSVKTKPCPFLKKTASLFALQEETAEATIPDSYPDVEKIVYCTASPVVRSKEFRAGSLIVSGGIRCNAVYTAETEEKTYCMDAYIPFSIRADNPSVSEDAKASVCCFIKSAEARMTNSRKILFRISVGMEADCYENSVQELYTIEEIPENLALLEKQYSMLLPTEMQEKPISITDEIAVDGQSGFSRLCGFTLQPVLDENKVSGNKVLLKGTLLAKVLYLTEAGTPESFTKPILFSQYLELDDSYEDAKAEIAFLCTGAEMEAEQDGDGTQLVLVAHFLTQCTLSRNEEITVYEDAYAMHAEFAPQWAEYAFEPLLDHQTLKERYNARLPVVASAVADFALFPDFVDVSPESDALQLSMPVTSNILYFDENRDLQGRTEKTTATAETALCEGCTAQVRGWIFPFGEMRAGSAQLELSYECTFSVKTYAAARLRTLSGGMLTESSEEGTDAPAVSVIKTAEPTTVWDIAKKYGAGRDRIIKINHLQQDEIDGGTMLLIPLQ